MAAMDRSVAWRAALLQGVAVAVIAVVARRDARRVVLPLTGAGSPGRACGRRARCSWRAVLRLPRAAGRWLGAALSGLPSLVAVLAGVHWAGTPLALLLFGALVRLARRARPRRERPRAVTA